MELCCTCDTLIIGRATERESSHRSLCAVTLSELALLAQFTDYLMAVLGAMLFARYVNPVVASVGALHDGLDITGKAHGARHSGALLFDYIQNENNK